MMKATDLRIGNIVLWENILHKVECIDGSRAHRDIGNNAVNIRSLKSEISYGRWTDDLVPIPLTPELLLKAGVREIMMDEQNTDEGFYYKLPIGEQPFNDLCFLSGDKNGKLEVCLFPYEDFFRFEFLHQIQNIYYSLTGEELKINL